MNAPAAGSNEEFVCEKNQLVTAATTRMRARKQTIFLANRIFRWTLFAFFGGDGMER